MISSTFAERVIEFNARLCIEESLPERIQALNPFQAGSPSRDISERFYRRFYSDNKPRDLILGINPGRLGAGATGIPFTDTKRLLSHCNMTCDFHLHEPSSVFVYEVIDAFGGTDKFYQRFFFSSVSPLGFVKINDKGKEINYNYYDDKSLEEAVLPFIVQSMQQVVSLGVNTERVYCLGTGKNFKFLQKFNKEHAFFGEIVPLEHPRYVMQYKNKKIGDYVEKYLNAFAQT
ncbi:MAG: uracil-DNA glycosylase family protein [Pseudomonadota bacterium]